MPVTMPGSAIGSTNSSVMRSLPGKRLRASANAARVPSTSAMNVAHGRDRQRQAHRLPDVGARERASNQRSVRPGGGNW